ncbi:Histone deacetylase [Candidatus Magnetomoraceae bacterium gMMP-15]
MKKTGFLYDERYLLHETGGWHPETSARLSAIYKGIEAAGLIPKLHVIQASKADLKWLETVHKKQYIESLEQACLENQKFFGSQDNAMCSETYNTALLAVGGILDTIDLVMNKKIKNAFCAVRPPGHHAEEAEGMGFCYFNNIAIAAKYLQQKWGIEKIGIIDFDVHHGNGTQHIFDQDPSVIFYSIHEHPSFSFPGTGREFEKGIGSGTGFTHNIPVLPGWGDKEYKKLLPREIDPVFEIFQPEFILMSCGFDGHVDDDMADIELTNEGFAWIIKKIKSLADNYCNGHLIGILEGGYCLERLTQLGAITMKILMEDQGN